MATDTKLLPLPTGYSADEWGGRDTGPCLHMDEQVQDYARANVAHATAQLQAEIEALRADLADYMRIANTEATRAERLAEALEFQSALTKNLLPYQDEAVASRAEIEALRVDVEAWKASHSMLTDTCHHFQARAKRLAEALRPLAELDLTPDAFDKRPDSQPIYARNNTVITVGDVRKARAALHPHRRTGGPVMPDLIERMRLLEQDHEPDGWPAVRMRDITALLAALEAAREDACVALVADIRFACGDNGKRMQPELVEYIRELAHSHARLQGSLPGTVTAAGTDAETGQPRLIIKTTEAALSDAPPLIYQRVRVVVEDAQ